MVGTRLVKVVLLCASVVVTAVYSPAVVATAASGTPVHIEAMTSFDPNVESTFVSNIDGCESGVVEGGRAAIPQSRGQLGVFAGEKVFACDEGGGFTLLLSARFPAGPGSVGRWAVVDSTGAMAGMHGTGSLLGFGFDGGVLDVYDGTLHS